MELNNIDEVTKAIFGRNIRKHLDTQSSVVFRGNHQFLNHMLFEITRTSKNANQIVFIFYILKDKYGAQ